MSNIMFFVFLSMIYIGICGVIASVEVGAQNKCQMQIDEAKRKTNISESGTVQIYKNDQFVFELTGREFFRRLQEPNK